jgi:hypothetical protein
MTLWWILFRGGSAAIIEAETLTHARILAVAKQCGWASHFVEGYEIDADLAEAIPGDVIGRKLSSEEADEVLAALRRRSDGASKRG